MRSRQNFRLISFFVGLTLVITWVVIFAWEKTLRAPFYGWVEGRYPDNPLEQWNLQQRGEHFFISATVDIIVVTLLLRLVERQQRRLRMTQERYQLIFEHAGDGIASVTAGDLQIRDTNHKFAEILGYAPQHLGGMGLLSLLRGDDSVSAPESFKRLLALAGAGEVELVLQGLNGQSCPVAVSFNSLVMDDEELLVLIMRDLSERRRLEAEKEEMQRRLFQSSKLASLGELSAGVAHEINNPLNCIINFGELLEDAPGLAPTERQMVHGIREEGERMARIVRNLLTFARCDSQELDPVNVREIIESSLALLALQLDTNNTLVNVEVEPDLPPVMADESRLRQVVVNLISNACNALKDKQTEAKALRIRARRVGAPGHPLVRMQFYDNGVGISLKNLDKVFDPFFTTRRASGGTGLGLSLSFGIIREYGGDIKISSEENRYTEVTIDLPAAVLQEAAHGESLVGG